MSPYLMIQPSPDFYGHVVEYGPLLMLWGCDPEAPKIPCGYQKQADRGKCNRWKCCWRDDGCFRSGCNLKMHFVSHFVKASLRQSVISPMRQFATRVTPFNLQNASFCLFVNSPKKSVTFPKVVLSLFIKTDAFWRSPNFLTIRRFFWQSTAFFWRLKRSASCREMMHWMRNVWKWR